MNRAKAVYRVLLHTYPAPFRREYGQQMCLTFAEQLSEARRTGGWLKGASVWTQAGVDILTIAPQEHWHVIRQDLRYALRTMSLNPGFAIVAILSLGLGIGANTAIFSLWNSLLRASLPRVAHPEGLVMLSDPGVSGHLRGGWNSRTSGPRPWFSYAEFEHFRRSTPAFAALMASQISLNSWRIRVDGGAFEEARGRLVSGSFFDVLGIRPALGRLFTIDEDAGEPPYAVISHSFWQRRFGGRPDVIGSTLIVRDVGVTIIGVAPPGFVGETAGQQPDLWLPLRLQPRVVPGSNWLSEIPPDKVMWLHVFGRLAPGVTPAQAENQANAAFRSGLESFYGSSGDQRRAEYLDQRLQVRPAARGASPSRDEFSSSLTLLLASVGVLLLIACANLANLLLARGAARQTEIAVRVSLGASRARLVRQMVTESLVLAIVGGLVGIAVAYLMEAAVVRLLQQAEPRLVVGFSLTLPVLGFALAVTGVAAVVFGVLPAWQVTRSEPGSHLRQASRGAIGSAAELRSGRWLVAGQLALSLPLLVGAGLLTQTVHNLQRAELGFPVEGLLLTSVNLGEMTQDVARRDRVLREILRRVQQIPGVEVASFSQLGLFAGGISTAMIDVQGSALTADGPRESALDRVGAGYFTTLGIPILQGRDISEHDRIDTHRVCFVNQAFVDRYFPGRQPIGMRVTTAGESARVSYEIVGIVGNARTQSLRDEVEPRFFVPAEQRPSSGSSRTFLMRTRSDPAAMTEDVGEAITKVDSSLSVSRITSLDEQVATLTAEERVIARLALVFGAVALALAAIGLYGVLAYAISRRSSEIAIRMALGADARTIIAMIFRETAGLVTAGLLAGAALAYLASGMTASRLYGVDPSDPLTATVATGALLLVALAAAYLPARRASRVEPMVALHHT